MVLSYARIGGQTGNPAEQRTQRGRGVWPKKSLLETRVASGLQVVLVANDEWTGASKVRDADSAYQLWGLSKGGTRWKRGAERLVHMPIAQKSKVERLKDVRQSCGRGYVAGREAEDD